MITPELDYKLIIIAGLMLLLVVVKLIARKPYDKPVRRPRRFGRHAEHAPTDLKAVKDEPKDPESEFFKDER